MRKKSQAAPRKQTLEPRRDCQAPHVDPLNLWWMLMSCVRYAMGRRSTAPSNTADWVRQYKVFLKPSQIQQIVDEVEFELLRCAECGETLGDECDDRTWRNLVDGLKVYLDPKNFSSCP